MQRNLNLIGQGSSGAKLILIGEHAVVYNNPAIAIPFNGLKTTVEVFKSNDELTIDCFFHKGYLKDGSNIINGLKELIKHILKRFNVNPFGLHFKITSDIISQRGLGSSASVSVAMVRALFDTYGFDLSDELLIELAMFAEKIHHTNPSGLDVYTMVYQKPIWFVKDQGFKVVDINFDGTIMILDSGMMSQTRIAVEHVATLFNHQELNLLEEFESLSTLTYQSYEALTNNDVDKLGVILNESQTSLAKMELSNDTLNSLINKAINLGALGAKLTGGGMGGCVIALIKNESEAKKIRKKLINIGVSNVWIYPLKELSK